MATGGNDITLKVGLQVDQSQGLQQVQQALAPMTRNIQNFNKNPILAKNFTQPLGRITGAADEFTKSLEASNARVLAFGASAGAIFAVQKAMTELVKTTITVEQKLTDISALLNVTDKEFKRFSDGLFQVARNTGLAFGEVADSANEFARQGKGVTETLKLTNSALALSKLGMMDSVNATESLTAALNTFRGEVNDSAVVVNKLAQVDAEFAVSSKDLAEAIKRTGSSAKDASVSFEELLAVVTVTQERTARGGAVIGNAFKTIFTRIQRPEVLNQLELIGVQVRKQNGEILPAIEILKQYASVYDSLNPALKSNTAQLIAGGRQINILKSLLPELAVGTGKFDAALKVANETTTEATDRLKILTSTTEGTLNAVTANLTKTAAQIGTLSVKPAIDNILGALDGLADLIGPDNFFGLGETIGKGVYEGIGRILSGPGLLLLGTVLAKLGGNLLKFVTTSGKSFLGLNKAADKQAQQQTIITNLLARQPEIVDRVLSGQLSIKDAAAGFNKELTFAEAHYDKLNNLASTLAAKQKTFSGPSKRRGNAAGLIPNFVPNFAMADVQAEREAASAGGYRAGQIRRMNMPGVGGVTYNGKEKVKKFPGMEQPAIMPPALSEAGKNYRDQFKSVIGFDPYNSAFGFVPNFSAVKRRQVNEISLDEMRTDPVLSQIIRGMTGPDSSKKQQMQKLGRAKGGDPAVRERMLNLTPLGQQRRKLKELSAEQRAEVRKGGTIDMQQKVGILSLLGGMNNPNATTTSSIGQLAVFDDILAGYNSQGRKLLSDAPITFKNVQVRSLDKAKEDIAKGKTTGVYNNFRKSLNDNLPDTLAAMAAAIGQPILGNQSDGVSELKKKLKGNVNSILPTGAEGAIFESLVRFITKRPGQFIASLGGDEQAAFDFEEANRAGKPFRHAFYGDEGFNPNALIKADAKRTSTASSVRELIKKSYNQAITSEDSAERRLMRDFKLPYTSALNLASGLVPNFSLKGISDAIKREDRAGVRRDKIRVGYDRRLKDSGGLGVYNTDEGSLGNAINMHMAAGRNKFQIQRQGKANGHIPNLAIVDPSHGTDPIGTGANLEKENTDALNKLTVALNKVGGSTFQGASKTSPSFGGPSLGQSSSPVLESVRKAEAKVIEEKIDKTKQENEKILKNSEAKDDNTSRSIANSFAITLAGDQIGQFGAKLSESDNVITSVIGSFAQLGGELTKYIPSVETALSVIGVEGNGIGDQLSNLKDKFGMLIVTSGGLAAAMQKATASALFGGGGRFATKGALGGRGLGVLGSARVTGRAFQKGGLDRVAKVTGGRGLVGGIAGLGAKGLAATGVGALAVGGLFAANKLLSKRREDTFKKLQENIKQTTDKFASMGKGLESLGKSVTDFSNAAKIGDKAAQEAARTQIRSDVAKVDFDQFFKDRGPVTLSSGRQVSSGSDVFGLLTDETASMDDKAQIQNLTSNYIKDLTRLNSNTSALASVLQEQTKGQNPLWFSTQAAQESINAANLAFGDIISQISGDQLVKVGAALEDLDESFERLGRGSDQLREKSLKSVSDKMQNLVTLLTKEGLSRDQIINALVSLQDAKGLDEEGTLRLYDETTKGLLPRVKQRIEAEKNLIDSEKDLEKAQKKQINEVETARKQSRALVERLDALKAALNTASKIADITRNSEAERAKIIRDNSIKINKLLLSDFSSVIQTFESTRKDTEEKFLNERQKINTKAAERALESASKFAEERLKEFEGNQGGLASNPDTQRAFDQVVNQLLVDIRRGQSTQDLINTIDKFSGLPIFNVGGVQSEESKTIFDDLRRQIKDGDIQTQRELETLAKQNEENKKIQQLQLQAQLDLLQVQQAIRFGGDGALNPLKALREFGQAQTNIARGRFTGNRDLETQGLVSVVNAFRGLQITQGSGTLGNIGNAVTNRLQEQIAGNLRTLISGVGLNEREFRGVRVKGIANETGIDAIARARALSITRPDRDPVVKALTGSSDSVVASINRLSDKFSIDNGAIKTSESNSAVLDAFNRIAPKKEEEEGKGTQSLTERIRTIRAQEDKVVGNIQRQEARLAELEAAQKVPLGSPKLGAQNVGLFEAQDTLARIDAAISKQLGDRSALEKVKLLNDPGNEKLGGSKSLEFLVKRRNTQLDVIERIESAIEKTVAELKADSLRRENEIKELKRLLELDRETLGREVGNRGRPGTGLRGERKRLQNERDEREKAASERAKKIKKETEEFDKAFNEFKAQFKDSKIAQEAAEVIKAFGTLGDVSNNLINLVQERAVKNPSQANQTDVIQSLVNDAARQAGIISKTKGSQFFTRGPLGAIMSALGLGADKFTTPTDLDEQRKSIGLDQLDSVIKDSTNIIKLYSGTIEEQASLQQKLRDESDKLLTSYREGEIGFVGFLRGLTKISRIFGKFAEEDDTPEIRAAGSTKRIQELLAQAGGSPLAGGNLEEFRGELSTLRQANIDQFRNRTANTGGNSEAARLFEFQGQIAEGANSLIDKFEGSGLTGSGYQQKVDEIVNFWSTLASEGGSVEERIQKFNSFRLRQEAEADDLAFDNNKINLTQRQAEANKRLQETFDASVYSTEQFSETLGEAIGSRFVYNATTAREQLSKTAIDATDDFKTGIKGALGEAIRGTATLREAFSSMFDKITDRILDNSLNMGVDALFGAVGTFFGSKGGLVKGYNSGGFVNQGSGVRDDVPAMMQGGEYVIRKSSVNKYGRGLFDALNSGGRVGYQTGDRIMQNRLRPEFVYNDPKRPTSGSYRNLEGLSAFALMESDSPMIAIQREREKTLEQYIKDKAAYDEMVRKAQEQFKKQQKARMKSTLISVGLQAATFGLSQMGQGTQGTGGVTGEPYSAGAAPGPYAPGKAPVYYGPANASNVKMYMPSGREFGPYTNMIRPSDIRDTSGGLINPETGLPYSLNAKGGLIKAFARGGHNRDNIPAMLMGGEYVVNKRSVDKYGVGLFNDLNSGRAQGFANGGMVGGDTSVTGGVPTTANNNFEINITMNGGGEGETTTTSNQNENQSQEQQERNEQLGLAVKNAVQTELIEQQRPGGLLYREDRI